MLFELSGNRGWRKVLNHEELCTVYEWQKWYNERYPKVAYLVEEYAYNEKNELEQEKENEKAAAEAAEILKSLEKTIEDKGNQQQQAQPSDIKTVIDEMTEKATK